MHILILNWKDHHHPRSGGAELVTFGHAKIWAAKRHKVTWFTTMFAGGKPHEVDNGVTILRKGSLFTLYFRAWWYVMTHGKTIDVIIDELHGIPFGTPLYTRKPIVAFIHEVAGEIWDYMYRFPFNVLGKYLERLFLKMYTSHMVWTDAPSTITDLVSIGFKKNNIVAIPCPTDMEPLHTLPKKGSTPTFIFVSRLVRMKGIEEVIKAFAFILKEEAKAKLLIVGKGDETYVAYLQRMTEKYGIAKHVRFYRNASDTEKKQLLGEAHILLHASVKEGWGLVVLEAASQATPAIVYNVSGLRDSVQNGKTGVVLKENSPREMATQAIFLYRDKKRYNTYQKAGIAFVKSINWKDVGNQSLAILEHAVKKDHS